MTWRPEWEEQPRGRFGFGGGMRHWGAAQTLVAACVAVTFVGMLLTVPGAMAPSSAWLGLSLRTARWVYPWLTYVFPHDVDDIGHLLINGVMLWFLGVELERRLGRSRFLTLFFGSALVGAIAHVFIQALAGIPSGMLIGASGGIFGLLFFIARETPDRPFVFWLVPVPAKILAALYVIKEVFPLLRSGLNGDGVAHLCHLGGALFGLLWFRWQFDAFDLLRATRGRVVAAAEERARERGASDDAEMDRLLAKIHDHGITSLEPRERAFLDERSKRMRGGPR